MADNRKFGILFRHAAAVVGDTDISHAAVCDFHLNGRGTGVHCIFHQFLHCIHRTLHHLTGGYLVGGDFIQNMNNCHYLPSLASLLKRKRISIASMGVLLITSIWASSSIIGDVKRSSPGDACFSGADFTGAGLFPSSSSP